MSDHDDDTTTFCTGLPVWITYNKTTGRWVVDVDLSDVPSGIRETLEDIENDPISEARVDEMIKAWYSLADDLHPEARTEVRFVV